MFLKRRVRRKDGKDHVCHSVCESLRVHGGRTLQRQILHLGEHREAFAAHLAAKWKDLFAAGFDIILCDLTSTCCEGSAERGAPGPPIRTAPTPHTNANLPHPALSPV